MIAPAIVAALLVTVAVAAAFLLVVWVAERWGTGWGILVFAVFLLAGLGLIARQGRRACERHWAEATTLMDTLRIVQMRCELPGRAP